MTQTSEKPAYLKGIMWFLFSATAMASAFLLPIHIWLLSNGGYTSKPTLIGRIYFFFIVFCALYHGLYRTQTILADVGLGRYRRITGALLFGVFLLAMGFVVYLLFWQLPRT